MNKKTYQVPSVQVMQVSPISVICSSTLSSGDGDDDLDKDDDGYILAE